MTNTTVETLRKLQLELRPKIYAVIDDDAARGILCAQYDGATEQLLAILGPDAHCNDVDSDLWSLISDLWKDDYNHRPRHHMTFAEAKAWLNRRSAEG